MGHVHFKHVGRHVLVPQPSEDPNDPLNWSPLWKHLSMGGMAISSFTLLFSPLSVAPQVPYYMHDFHSSLPDVINFVRSYNSVMAIPKLKKYLDWYNHSRPRVLQHYLGSCGTNLWPTSYAYGRNSCYSRFQHLEGSGKNLQLVPRCMYSLWNWGWACRDPRSHCKFSAARLAVGEWGTDSSNS